MLLPSKRMGTMSTRTILREVLEGEWSEYIHEVFNMVVGILMSQSTEHPLKLQELQHGTCDVKHRIPFGQMQVNDNIPP